MKKNRIKTLKEFIEKYKKVEQCCTCGLHQYVEKKATSFKCRQCGILNDVKK